MDQAKERHVLGLDLIRFAAAAMVMTFHFGHDIGPIPLSWPGWVGVEVFFVLSGYVIAASAEGSAPARFAVNRTVRLMPAVWICSSITAAVCLVQQAYPDLAGRYLNSVILWPTGPWVDGALWTLPVEVVFYGLVFLSLLGRFELGWVLRAIAVASFLYWVLRLASQYHLPSAAAADGLSEPFARLSMLAFGCYFAVGGLMREALAKGLTWERSGFIALGLLGSGVQIAFAASNWAPGAEFAGLPHAGKIVPLLIWLGLVALMAASVMGNATAWRMLPRAAPIVRLLGLATYPLYLLHDTVGNALKFMPAARTPLLASALAICIALAVAATIEPWAQRGLRTVLSPRRTPPAPANLPAGP